MMNLEPCREITAAIRPVEEELHQNCSQSRQQDGLLQPMSGCGRQAHVAPCSPKPKGLWGQGSATPLCVVLSAHLCCILVGDFLFYYFFHHAFLTSLMGDINHVAQEWWGFPLTQHYYGEGWSQHFAWGRNTPCSLERWLMLRVLCTTRLHKGCNRLSLVGNEKDMDSFVSLTWS